MSTLYLNSKLTTSLSFPHGAFSDLNSFITECINKLNSVNPSFKIDNYGLNNILSEGSWNTDATYFGYIKGESIYAYI